VSRTALGTTQSPIQWIPGALSLGVKRPVREADHILPSSAEAKKMSGAILPLLQYACMALCSFKIAQEQLYTYLLYSIVSSHLRLYLQSGLLPSGFPTQILSPMRATCSARLILLNLITLIIFGEAYKLLFVCLFRNVVNKLWLPFTGIFKEFTKWGVAMWSVCCTAFGHLTHHPKYWALSDFPESGDHQLPHNLTTVWQVPWIFRSG